MSDNKIIFSMVGVGKIHKPNKQVLKDIYLSFFYGAKIGVLGLNGAGKSTLLRIIAGIDKDYIGEITSQKGISFGYLPQEPQLDAGKTVKEIVEEGVHEIVALIKEYEAVTAKFGEPDADIDKLLEKQGNLQEKIEHLNAWDIDSKLEQAMVRSAVPPATRRSLSSPAESGAVSRSAAFFSGAGCAAARRTDEPSRCRIGRLA